MQGHWHASFLCTCFVWSAGRTLSSPFSAKLSGTQLCSGHLCSEPCQLPSLLLHSEVFLVLHVPLAAARLACLLFPRRSCFVSVAFGRWGIHFNSLFAYKSLLTPQAWVQMPSLPWKTFLSPTNQNQSFFPLSSSLLAYCVYHFTHVGLSHLYLAGLFISPYLYPTILSWKPVCHWHYARIWGYNGEQKADMVPVLPELTVFGWREAVRAQWNPPAKPSAVTRAREMGRWVCVCVCDCSLLNVSDSLWLGGAGSRISQLWHVMTYMFSVVGWSVYPQKIRGSLRPSSCEHDWSRVFASATKWRWGHPRFGGP